MYIASYGADRKNTRIYTPKKTLGMVDQPCIRDGVIMVHANVWLALRPTQTEVAITSSVMICHTIYTFLGHLSQSGVVRTNFYTE